jgi:hypothetical protein
MVHRSLYVVLVQHTKTGKNKQNDYKMYQMATRCTKGLSNITNGHKIYQHFPFQGPPKYTQIEIFGLKIYHLATLGTRRADVNGNEVRWQTENIHKAIVCCVHRSRGVNEHHQIKPISVLFQRLRRYNKGLAMSIRSMVAMEAGLKRLFEKEFVRNRDCPTSEMLNSVTHFRSFFHKYFQTVLNEGFCFDQCFVMHFVKTGQCCSKVVSSVQTNLIPAFVFAKVYQGSTLNSNQLENS